ASRQLSAGRGRPPKSAVRRPLVRTRLPMTVCLMEAHSWPIGTPTLHQQLSQINAAVKAAAASYDATERQSSVTFGASDDAGFGASSHARPPPHAVAAATIPFVSESKPQL